MPETACVMYKMHRVWSLVSAALLREYVLVLGIFDHRLNLCVCYMTDSLKNTFWKITFKEKDNLWWRVLFPNMSNIRVIVVTVGRRLIMRWIIVKNEMFRDCHLFLSDLIGGRVKTVVGLERKFFRDGKRKRRTNMAHCKYSFIATPGGRRKQKVCSLHFLCLCAL